MASLCCNAETHIGYYNADKNIDSLTVIGTVGTFCNKCGKLCDFISNGIEYTTDGKKKIKKDV